jgi:hypothetical protein
MIKTVKTAVMGGLLAAGVAQSFAGTTAAPKTNFVYNVNFAITAYVDGASKPVTLVTKDLLSKLSSSYTNGSLIYKLTNGVGNGNFYYRTKVKGTNVDTVASQFSKTNEVTASLNGGTQKVSLQSIGFEGTKIQGSLAGVTTEKRAASGGALSAFTADSLAGSGTVLGVFTNAVFSGKFDLTFTGKE